MDSERKKFFLEELEQLRKGQYLDENSIDEVKNAYRYYLMDCDEELKLKAAAPKNELSDFEKNQQKELERREFINSLVGKSKNSNREPRKDEVEPILAKETPVPSILKKPAVRTSVERREHNLSLILTLGVVLLLLGGLVLATTSWFILGSFMKVTLILSISGLFGGMGFVAHKLKIKQTSFAFVSLAFLFLPITVISGAYYQLFGSYLSLTGDGRNVLGFLVCSSFTLLYYWVAKVYQSKIFRWLSLGLFYLTQVFLAIMLTGTSQMAIAVLGFLIMGLIVSNSYFKGKTVIRFFENEWSNYQVLVIICSSFWLLASFNVSISSIVAYFVFSILWFICGIQRIRFGLVFQIIGNVLMYLGIVSILFLNATISDSFLVLLASMLVVAFSWLTKLKLLEKIPDLFIRRQMIFSYLVNLFVLLVIGSWILLTSQGVTIGSPVERISLGIALFVLLSGMYQMFLFKKNILTFSLLILMSYLVSGSMFSLMEFPRQTIAYLMCIVSLLGYSLVFVIKRLQPNWLTLGITSWIVFQLASNTIFMKMSAFEQSFWLGMIWLLFLMTKLRIQLIPQKVMAWCVSVGLGIVCGPVLFLYQEQAWAYVAVSLVILLFSMMMNLVKQKDLVKTSQLVASGFYLMSGLVLLNQVVAQTANWFGLFVLGYGVYFCYLLRDQIQLKFRSLGGLLFATLTFVYPLYLIDASSFVQIIYLEVLASVFFFASYLMKKEVEVIYYLKRYSRCMSHFLFVISLVIALYVGDLLANPVVFCLPMFIYGISIKLTGKLRNKQGYLGLLLVLCYFFFISLSQVFELVWLTSGLIIWFLAAGLVVSYWKFKKGQKIIEPIGFIMSCIALVVNIPLSYSAIEWLQVMMSLVAWVIITIYLKAYLKGNVDNLLWIGIFCLVAWELQTLFFYGYFGILLLIIVVRSMISYVKRQPLLVIQPLKIDTSLILTGVGYLFLRLLVANESQPYFEAGLILYLLLYLVAFFKFETGEKEKSFLQTIFYVSLADLAYWCVGNWQEMLYSSAILSIKVTIALLLVSILLRKVWQVIDKYLFVEFGVVAFGLVILMIEALVTGGLVQQLTFSIIALMYVIGGFMFKYKSYFISGSVGILLSLAYNQRRFWSTIPWWMYLILGGMLLIIVASSAEWRNRRKEQGAPTLIKKLVSYFVNWN
ncbi:hypothetical protein ACWOFR_15550 [Carnobacterium gallinarum]|uniref:hypothetical protein n=1 Tax=Carnobacterium gallinarum TaxID=2749 RepID=UPI0005518434|nr:hypothetical protein [Carnobacterium gallinarum]